MDVVVMGGYAYVANQGQLQVVDVRDLDLIELAGFCPTLMEN